MDALLREARQRDSEDEGNAELPTDGIEHVFEKLSSPSSLTDEQLDAGLAALQIDASILTRAVKGPTFLKILPGKAKNVSADYGVRILHHWKRVGATAAAGAIAAAIVLFVNHDAKEKHAWKAIQQIQSLVGNIGSPMEGSGACLTVAGRVEPGRSVFPLHEKCKAKTEGSVAKTGRGSQ